LKRIHAALVTKYNFVPCLYKVTGDGLADVAGADNSDCLLHGF
jgi:hypothetical protein